MKREDIIVRVVIVASIVYFIVLISVGIWGSMNNHIWTMRDCYFNSSLCVLEERRVEFTFQVIVDPPPSPATFVPFYLTSTDCLTREFDTTAKYNCELEDHEMKKIVQVLFEDQAGPLVNFGMAWFIGGFLLWAALLLVWAGSEDFIGYYKK